MANNNNHCLSPPQPISTLSQIKWDLDNDSFLSDFVQRHALPHVALITKGQYLTLGAPTVNTPNLKPYLYVHSVKRVRKLVGRLVKSMTTSKGAVLGEQKICIPEYFSGYFEILSEDGRRIKCIESVQELVERFPEMCLVRQQCKAYVPDIDGELRSLYKSRTLDVGEVLTVVGRFNFKKNTFLRLFDEQGRSVYLKMSQKVKFSTLARRDSVAGVHNVQNLLAKRLPLTVRLINGEISPDLHKFASNMTVRLQHLYAEDVVFVYSMHKPEGQFLTVPLNAHLKLAPVFNYQQLMQRSDFQDMYALCEDSAKSYYDRITSFHDYNQIQIRFEDHSLGLGIVPNGNNSNGHHHRPSFKDCHNNNNNSDDVMHVTHIEVDPSTDIMETTQEEPVECDDEEIDQLYDYIRGLAPLPHSAVENGAASRSRDQEVTGGHRRRRRRLKQPTSPPPPPPVETIPGRSVINSNSLQSPTRSTSNGHHAHGHHHHHHHHRPLSPVKPSLTNGQQQHYASQYMGATGPQQQQSINEPTPATSGFNNSSSRLKYHSSTSTSPSNTNTSGAAPPSAEKRLDGIIYGSRGALNILDSAVIRKPDEQHLRTATNSSSNNRHHATPQQHQHRNGGTTPNANGQGHAMMTSSSSGNRRRPLSMVIPDRIPLFDKNAPVAAASTATRPRDAPDYYNKLQTPVGRAAAMRGKITHDSDASPYQQQQHAYRSHMNLNFVTHDDQPTQNNSNNNTTSRSRSPPTPHAKISVPHYQKFVAYPRYSSQYALSSNGHYRM